MSVSAMARFGASSLRRRSPLKKSWAPPSRTGLTSRPSSMNARRLGSKHGAHAWPVPGGQRLYAKVLHGQTFVAALRHDGNKHDPGKPQEIPPAGSTMPKIHRITPRAQRGGDRARGKQPCCPASATVTLTWGCWFSYRRPGPPLAVLWFG
jgi:hypothetical protein